MIDTTDFPWQIVERMEFQKANVLITFTSGNALSATHNDPAIIEKFKAESIEKLGKEKVFE